MTPRIAQLPLVAGIAALVLAGGLAAHAAGSEASPHWPQFRGARAEGVAEGYSLPEKWNAEAEDGAALQNIRWKTPIPGLAHSSPVIWGDKLFVTTAITGKERADLKVGLYGDIKPVEDDTVHEYKVYCLDKRSGKVLWDRTAVRSVPKVKRHTKSTHANPTAATDGKRVVASFGSEGLYCFDMNGKQLWKVDLGVLDSGFFLVPSAQWGFASSPILWKNRVIVQCDIQKGSFLAALDAATGKEIWRTAREETPTWGTPTVVEHDRRAQIVVNGWKHMGAYDAESGRELWKLSGGGDLPVPTPVYGHGLVFLCNAHGRMAPLYAIKPDATGTITPKPEETSSASIPWWTPRNGAYMQTPLVYGDHLYSCTDSGILSCYEAKTGKQLYRERLGTGKTGFSGSPVAGDGKLYFTSEQGETYIVKAGPTFQVTASNALGEVCMATPALSQGSIYFRTQGHVVAVGAQKGGGGVTGK